MTTKRKPYIREMAPSWWQRLGFYRFYMLREGTALPAVWFSLLLIHGLYRLKAGPAGWESFIHLLQNPVVMLLNLIALAAALLHSKTWFDLAPRAAIVIIKGEKLGPAPVVRLLWAAMIAVSLIILTITLYSSGG
ncbi:MAG: fumarate reductase subunit FrdC [Yersiniaceae bacterium]|nr:fumarate reductase subunit FrdC [Yersiniaceae bacterium]